jgi:hypothetical protein
MKALKHILCSTCLLLALQAASGCSDDDDIGPDSRLVGGSCTSDGHCEFICTRDGDFPGGMCTVRCRDDRDCPSGTACVDRDGGICAIGCGAHRDCDPFGLDYACDDTDRRGADGDVFVCKRP